MSFIYQSRETRASCYESDLVDPTKIVFRFIGNQRLISMKQPRLKLSEKGRIKGIAFSNFFIARRQW